MSLFEFVILIFACFMSNCEWAGALSSPFGIVEGIRDCGSTGKLGTVQVTDCTVVPCKFVPEVIYDISIRFTASASSDYLALHVYRKSDQLLIMSVPTDGNIEAGIEYELKFRLPVTNELSGTAFDIQFYIWDEAAWVEVCAEASVEVA